MNKDGRGSTIVDKEMDDLEKFQEIVMEYGEEEGELDDSEV